MIRFSNPQAAIDVTAKIGADGAYDVFMGRRRGLPEGTYRVAVRPPGVKIPLGPMVKLPPLPERLDIPERYRQPSSSGLTFTVRPGQNSFDVDMQP